MLDRHALSPWIQSQHLDGDAITAYREAFTSHPARLVLLKHFLEPAVADRLHRFLAQEATFRPEYGLYSVEGAVSEETWRLAKDDDRLFKLGKLAGTPPQFRTSPNALTYLQFRMAFQRPEFKAFFEGLTGMSLGWSDDFGSHAMTAGDLLRPHSDDNRNRQVALVIYLSPGWTREAGGILRVIHKDEQFTDVEPEYNSMVLFDVLAAPAHFVSPIQMNGGVPWTRLTIGGWYHRAG